MLSSVVFITLLSYTTPILALNDWSVPCFDGTCSYETELGSMKIWGSSDAISDITTAGGWEILDCDPKVLSQNIRLVCTHTDGCTHLEQGGAVDTLIRLPESCGASAFARVARMWVHQDQSLPSHIRRRAGAANNKVQGLAIDTNFAAVDPSKSGNVNIAVTGSNVPGNNGNATVANVSASSRRRSRRTVDRRGFISFIEDSFDKFDSFDENVTKKLPPIDQSKSVNLFNKKVECGAFEAEMKADATAKAHAVISLGVATSGTIVPPKLSSFGLFAGLDATLDGKITLSGSGKATADSGKITLFEVGIPGLDFPGILTLGPSFKINGQATASLDIGVDVDVDLSYNINGAKLFFPKSANHQSGGSFVPGNNPLSLSVTPKLAAKGEVTAHIIPTIELGISALGSIAKATVNLDLDASATTTLTLDASAGASATVSGGKLKTDTSGPVVSGCVDVSAGLDVNAGADAKFFDLFDPSTSVSLFKKDFDLFKKCFGNGSGGERKRRRSSFPHTLFPRYERTLFKRFTLSCPAEDLSEKVSLTDPNSTANKAAPESTNLVADQSGDESSGDVADADASLDGTSTDDSSTDTSNADTADVDQSASDNEAANDDTTNDIDGIDGSDSSAIDDTSTDSDDTSLPGNEDTSDNSDFTDSAFGDSADDFKNTDSQLSDDSDFGSDPSNFSGDDNAADEQDPNIEDTPDDDENTSGDDGDFDSVSDSDDAESDDSSSEDFDDSTDFSNDTDFGSSNFF